MMFLGLQSFVCRCPTCRREEAWRRGWQQYGVRLEFDRLVRAVGGTLELGMGPFVPRLIPGETVIVGPDFQIGFL